MDGLATVLPLSTSHKFRVATLSFLFGAICLCLVPGLWAQSAKAPGTCIRQQQSTRIDPPEHRLRLFHREKPTAVVRPQHRSPGKPKANPDDPLLVLISGHNDLGFQKQ